MIKLARFASDEKLAFIDNRQFDGNIFECIDQAYKYIVRALNEKRNRRFPWRRFGRLL